ncbi:MAG TPA: ABC transporter permease [Candidatus Acidoferrales bacterium]|nr:ABC transporter permease [Candidatus Acidoferrales bacterium]
MINYVLEAFSSLLAQRLRTALAILGLAVGVGAVIAIQILGHSMAGAMAGVFKGFSNYTFIIQPNFSSGFDAKAAISLDQVELFDAIPHVVQAIPFDQHALQMRIEHKTAQLVVAPIGGDPNFYPDPFAQGRPISAQEASSGAHVCVLSADAATKLGIDPAELIGKELRGGAIRCSIVGVLAAPPQGALSFDFAPGVSVPYALYERTYLRGSSKIYVVQVLVDDPRNIAGAEDRAKAMIARMGNGKYSYQTFDNQFFANAFDKIFLILTLVVGTIGAISLAVAGIGIMNILLVSIVERTREIGVRKAIGGTRGQIMTQFAIEAATLTFAGCLIGAAIGVAIGWWINSAFIVKISGVIVPVPWLESVILAVVFAAIVTLAFGIYPALRAASLDPIEALRYE